MIGQTEEDSITKEESLSRKLLMTTVEAEAEVEALAMETTDVMEAEVVVLSTALYGMEKGSMNRNDHIMRYPSENHSQDLLASSPKSFPSMARTVKLTSLISLKVTLPMWFFWAPMKRILIY